MKNLIGFVGRRRSGKDTAAQTLIQDGFIALKFADILKAMLRTFFDYVGEDPALVERFIEGDLKETPLTFFGGKSTRYAMQTLGTEWGRDLIWQNLWVAATLARAKTLENVVISDVRFPNEADAIHAVGGKLIRIFRGSQTVTDTHPSETLIDGIDADYEITNDGPLTELHDKIQLTRALIESTNPEVLNYGRD